MPQTALERNVQAAEETATQPPQPPHTNNTQLAAASDEPPHSTPRTRRLNLSQESLVREFTAAYGIDPAQIYFEKESAEPYFGFEALSQLAIELAPDVHDISVQAVEVNQATGLVLSRGTVVLTDGRSRSGDAGCIVGDALPSGLLVETIKSALDVSGARALQKALRMVGFDPVRAHEAKKNSGAQDTLRLSPEQEQRNKELAEIHKLADECGLIDGKDKSKYRQQIGIWFEGKNSSEDLTPRERAQLIAILRGIKTARMRSDDAQ
jgi:hypothetical protein